MSERTREAVGCSLRRTKFAAILVLSTCLIASATTEEALFRQIKIHVFDEEWTAVQAGCEEFLARFPDSHQMSQIAFYRARALSKMTGRQGEAIEAFQDFLRGHQEDKLLVEEAWSSIFALACDGDHRHATPECASILREGLRSPSVFVSTLAAIRAADTRNGELRRLALGLLRKACDMDLDRDIRDEIAIAILKIDPGQIPPSCTGASDGPTVGSDARREPSIIRLTVFNKESERFEIKVAFPVAFARMLIDALGESHKEELRREARQQGIDIDRIFEAIKKAGVGRLVEVDTADVHIELRLE